ncbi:hybrid sensor histidine kinase/response regulator [Burkholderia glumae]|uniref:histidine kinase n=1 Tax=Burkholderia glumae TaxID=337 RepID=A0AAP9XX03_BURGL|nr:hybrid sensor histidine kinase/response regulator [Burkholderia glumae]ACR32040.1 Response regulator/sensor histidine kinase [Burkholderia glumae BGR1]AJY63882.1 response regulator [Burkholderia glumae LMG 2196 = ATCC 33617]KHJ60957.1 chemotaxis protein CheY [Burkholderia glumae]MCM2484784.1 hybrid sensor histidine kinase/response regulator [Burkholderia glumae]MCM2495165.1 hybrid sensor histidine kinase/response regulator [Burkholderia glumae]
MNGMTHTNYASDSYESGISVLLVDDQAFVGEVIRRLLAAETDIALHVCGDAGSALELGRTLRPTVILQDLVMPGVDGLELVRAWRAEAATAQVPIIVLSINDDPLAKREAFVAGANDYLVKLPDPIEMIARIRYHSNSYHMLRQRDEVLDFLSHDMRAPQASILSLLEGYRATHGEMPMLLERIEVHARRALALADGFIQLTRAQSEKRPSELVCLNEVLLDAADQLWEKAAATGSRVKVVLPEAECLCVGDRMMLTRALANLIDNALKYAPPASEVRGLIADDGERWLIGVEDEGEGIAPAQRASATESFVRLTHGPDSQKGGFGLGLAFVRATATKHGGALLMRYTPRGFMAGLGLPKARAAR